MVEQLDSGEQILLNGQPAEVITVRRVGELPYLRAYVEGEGVKSVCAEDVDIKRPQENGESEEAFDLEDLSAERFDLRTQAMRFRLAHQRGQLLSISNSLVRLEPYQLACVNQVMQKLRQRTDPRRYNGAIFLGLNGITVKSHGGTDAVGFANAIDVSVDMVREGFLERIRADLASIDRAVPDAQAMAG